MSIKVKKIKLTTVINVLIMFFFIFDIAFIGIPTVFSTRKISALCMLIKIMKKKVNDNSCKRDLNIVTKLIICLILILIYIFIISLIQNSIFNINSILSRLIFMIVYLFIGIFYSIRVYSGVIPFMRDIMSSLLIQSVIIYIEFISLPFKIFLTSFIANPGNVDFIRTDRGTGLGAEAGFLTLLLFMGVFCCNYFIIMYGFKKKYVILELIYVIAMFAVGRTGIYASIVLILVSLAYSVFNNKQCINFLKYIIAVIILFIIAIIIVQNFISVEQYMRFSSRFLSGLLDFSNDGSTIQIQNMVIPPLSFDTVIGTGIYRGILPNGALLWHDGGYIQSYASLGIVCCSIFYISIISTFFKLRKNLAKKDNLQKLLIDTYFILLLICEYKEPFMMKTILLFFIFTFTILTNKDIQTK